MNKNFCIYLSLFLPAVISFSGCSEMAQPALLETVDTATTEVVSRTDATGETVDGFSLSALLKQSIEPATVTTPTPDELNRFTGLIEQTLKSADVDSVRSQWLEQGWVVHADPRTDIVVITEHPDARRGRGIYSIRLQSESGLVLQAPHRFYDRRTGTIVRKLFLENDVRAAAWNSVHREQVDIAHESRHFMAAFTEAMLSVNDQFAIIQLHGFANGSRSGNARNASLIVSNSTRFPGRLARDVAIELKQQLGIEQVLLYPLEVSELGGTTNAQASIVRGTGNPNFLHLEMNAGLRQQIAETASKRREFFLAIEEAAPPSGQIRE